MEGRGRITLYQHMTASETSHRHSLSSLFSHDTVLSSQTVTTSLSDIIKQNQDNNVKYWKSFKNKFRFKRTEPVQSSTTHNNTPIPIPIPITSHQNNRTLLSQFSVQEENDVVEGDSNNEVGGRGNMLVMDLLEERDIEETEILEEAIEEEEEEEEEEESEVDNNNGCCVCMVRDKGAAFIPCGHVFCRICCNEIWVSSGICPLCNHFVFQILHLF